jgi:hypothetical protein
MGRRVVYIIVDDDDEGKGTDLTFRIDNSSQLIQLKGGGNKVAETDSNNADAVQFKGGEGFLQIANPAEQDAARKVALSERDGTQSYPTSVNSDEPTQPLSKRLVQLFRNFTWETAKTAFKAAITTLVRFLLRLIFQLPF